MEDLSYLESYKDTATEALKVPPHSIEAEQSVLGSLISVQLPIYSNSLNLLMSLL